MVDGHAQARARRAQADGELGRLEREIAAWVRLRNDRDRLRQYATPLATLERTLLGAVRNLRGEVDAIDPGGPPGAVYASCRRVDRQAAVVRGVWAWFRAKFDQRDDETLGGLLAAADEVVWSCYQEAFASAELTLAPVAPRGPAPLPYVDPGGAVEAFVRDRPPAGLFAPEDGDHEQVREFLARLPVPVISLPAACLDAPWWLALIAHEVGHHLQYDLLPDAALVREIGDAVELAVLRQPNPVGDAPTAARWRRYGEEVFADACAVASVGAGAVTAILQLELDTEQRLLAGGRGRYPRAVVRLALIAELANQVGLDGAAALDGLDPAALAAAREPDRGPDPLAGQRAAARRDLAQVGKVAEAVLSAPLGGAGPLADLFSFRPLDHQPGGRVRAWAESILRGTARPDATRLRAPRDQIAGAVLAWRDAVTVADDTERGATLASLAETLPKLVAKSRKAGLRAGDRERGSQDLSAELTAALRADVEEEPDDDPEGEAGG